MPLSTERIDALLDTIVPMEQKTKHARILIFGESGTGKTIMGASVGNRVLYIESDPEGWVSLQNHPELLQGNRMSYMRYMGLSQLDAVCQAYEDNHPVISAHDTIFVDTLNAATIKDLDIVVKQRASEDPTKSADIATLPDYGHNTERVRKVVTRLCSLPCNIVFTAHAREDTDDSVGMILTRPDFTPKLRKHIERAMHLTGYLTAVTGAPSDEGVASYTRKLQVHPTRRINAKSRIGGLPVVLDNPDLGQIIDSWLKSGGNEATPAIPVDDTHGVDYVPSVNTSPEKGLEI